MVHITTLWEGHAPMHALPSYQPPPPVVTEQPRTIKEPTHLKPYKHPYGTQKAKPLTSLAEKVHNYQDTDFYSPTYPLDSSRTDPGKVLCNLETV